MHVTNDMPTLEVSGYCYFYSYWYLILFHLNVLFSLNDVGRITFAFIADFALQCSDSDVLSQTQIGIHLIPNICRTAMVFSFKARILQNVYSVGSESPGHMDSSHLLLISQVTLAKLVTLCLCSFIFKGSMILGFTSEVLMNTK